MRDVVEQHGGLIIVAAHPLQDSPHSSDQLQLFAAHKLKPVWFSEADIRAHTDRAYRP